MAWENKKSSRTFKLARLKVENTKQSKQLLNSDLVGRCKGSVGVDPCHQLFMRPMAQVNTAFVKVTPHTLMGWGMRMTMFRTLKKCFLETASAIFERVMKMRRENVHLAAMKRE